MLLEVYLEAHDPQAEIDLLQYLVLAYDVAFVSPQCLRTRGLKSFEDLILGIRWPLLSVIKDGIPRSNL